MTQRELDQRTKSAQQSCPLDPLCIHRACSPVGKLKCTCTVAPAVYPCRLPWVASGYCMPALPQQPGDGPIVTADGGEKIVPADDRRTLFSPMPMRAGEQPRPWDIVVCASCPHRSEPPPHIAALLRLGILGDYDPDTGHADLIHVTPDSPTWRWRASDYAAATPPSMRGVHLHPATPDLAAVIAATSPRLLILHDAAADPADVATAAREATYVRFWSVQHDWPAPQLAARQRKLIALAEALPNCWYGTAANLPWVSLGLFRAMRWEDVRPQADVQTAPTHPDPPVILIDPDDQHASAYVLAAALVSRQRTVTVSTIATASAGPLKDTAAAVDVTLDLIPSRGRAAMRTLLRESVSVCLSSGLLAAESLSAACPAIGSDPSLPARWRPDCADPTAIARSISSILSDHHAAALLAAQQAAAVTAARNKSYAVRLSRILP